MNFIKYLPKERKNIKLLNTFPKSYVFRKKLAFREQFIILETRCFVLKALSF